MKTAPSTSRRRKAPVRKAAVDVEPQLEQTVVPYDENLLERARTQWQFGDWESLTRLDRDTLQHHPDRAKLALLAAAGHMQAGRMGEARQFVRLSKDWGVSNQLISRILIAGVHNSLGRTSILLSNQSRANEHFAKSVAIGSPGGELKLLMQARVANQCNLLGLSGNGGSARSIRAEQRTIDMADAHTTNGTPMSEKAKGPKYMPFEKCLPFNGAYRMAWANYLGSRTTDEIAVLTEHLIAGLDDQSREIVSLQLDLVAPSAPSRLAKYLFIDPAAKVGVLPSETKEQLVSLGFFSNQEQKLVALQIELQLPELPLKELLTEGGLSYLSSDERQGIVGGTVVDAGAYIGDTAHLFVKRYRPSRVIALEPHPLTFSRLEKNLQIWGLAGAIIPINCAVGGDSAEVRIWGSGVGASKIRKMGPAGEEATAIPQRTIDSVVAQYAIGRVSLLKLDVEGDEYAAIMGGKETIARYRPILLVSVYHTAKDFFEIKPLIASICPDYRFILRKTTDDLIKEFVLIAFIPKG